MIITDEKQKAILLEAGRRLRGVLDTVREHITPGTTTKALDTLAHEMIVAGGDKPAFLNYQPGSMTVAFPATLCVSLNSEMVHGVPNPETVIQDGDIVSIDCGLEHNGVFVDAAYTVVVGEGDPRAHALIEAARKALQYALVVVRAGATTGDIGNAIETVAEEHRYTIPPELGGHGVGSAQHEDPFIPNIGNPGEGAMLRNGEVIAIEPIFSEGTDPQAVLGSDGFAYCTKDGARAAHFEHTVLVTDSTPVIVTGPMW